MFQRARAFGCETSDSVAEVQEKFNEGTDLSPYSTVGDRGTVLVPVNAGR